MTAARARSLRCARRLLVVTAVVVVTALPSCATPLDAQAPDTREALEALRFEPVEFDRGMVSLVAKTAAQLGHTVMTLPSGAGHDAQMFARICPTAMIFTPSRNGLSHNPAEFTEPDDLAAGANVLLHTMLALASA